MIKAIVTDIERRFGDFGEYAAPPERNRLWLAGPNAASGTMT